jgi:hypothetical protein
MIIERGNFILELENQWLQFTRKFNWWTFDFILLRVEDDKMLGAYELEVALLGFALRARWHVRDTEATKSLAEQIAKFQDEAND